MLFSKINGAYRRSGASPLLGHFDLSASSEVFLAGSNEEGIRIFALVVVDIVRAWERGPEKVVSRELKNMVTVATMGKWLLYRVLRVKIDGQCPFARSSPMELENPVSLSRLRHGVSKRSW